MKLNTNTPAKWEQFRDIIGLPGHIKVKDVPQVLDNTTLARFFFTPKENGRAANTAKAGGQHVQA